MQMTLGTKIRMAGYAIKSLITKPVYLGYKPMDPEFANDTRAVYRQMINHQNMFWSPFTMGWHASGDHQAMGKWLKDERLTTAFSSWTFAPKMETNTEFDQMLASQLMSLPDADHRRLRKLVSPAFSPRYADSIRDAAQATVELALTDVDQNGLIDICHLTRDIPSLILARYIGVPVESLDDFNALGQSVIASFDTTATPDIAGATRGIALIKQLMTEKRQHPDDSFLSTLVNHVEDGERITEMEAVALLASLFAAGVETTSNVLNVVIYSLAKHDGWSAWLAQHPERALDVIAESLRWRVATHRGHTRFAKEDVEINGYTVRKGEMVQLMNHITGLDEITFVDAHEFNPARENLKKYGIFGEGAHYCLGHALAKLITETTVLALVKRYPQLRIEKEPCFEYALSGYHMNGLLVRGKTHVANKPTHQETEKKYCGTKYISQAA